MPDEVMIMNQDNEITYIKDGWEMVLRQTPKDRK